MTGYYLVATLAIINLRVWLEGRLSNLQRIRVEGK